MSNTAEAERAATVLRGRRLLDGVGELCPWRRGRVSRAAGTQLGPFTSHPHQQQRQERGDGVGRRPKTPPDGVGERSPAPATAAAALWFQSQGQRQWALLADNETAQALQHGCGDDCWRSASLAALHCTRDR